MSSKSREDKKHFARIRMLFCVKCGSGANTEVSHIRKGTDGGTGLKPSAWFVLPLCHSCHYCSHRGEVTFFGGMEGVYKAIDWARKLYDAKDIFEAQRIVIRARKDLFE